MNKWNIFHSIPEALTYFLLLLVIILNIVILIASNRNTQQIEQQQACFTSFFLQSNRQNITLANLANCNAVVRPVKQ